MSIVQASSPTTGNLVICSHGVHHYEISLPTLTTRGGIAALTILSPRGQADVRTRSSVILKKFWDKIQQVAERPDDRV